MLNKVDAFGTSYSLHKINKKTPIVFVHGVGLTKEIWEPQIGFFKDYNNGCNRFHLALDSTLFPMLRSYVIVLPLCIPEIQRLLLVYIHIFH